MLASIATRPRFAPDPARRPSGEPAVIEGSAGKQEDLRKENESAAVLATAGYDIEQNPPARHNGREPDYRMQGEYWDCYAPGGDNLRTVETAIRRKVGKTEAKCQADRIILNLDNFDLDHTMIRAHLERFPIRRLKEIKIVKHGTVTQFYPWDSEVDPHGD
ncbi:hypothetical protein [Glycomyces tenuis]|uniref:CdiA C-terminal domain-containing protein n=1 Tax=Glycomyces tenuis TaxID=58116 RepID=UPI00047C0A27|nr:hypothetical protein [Glycomyces tenuis]